jgi:DivIVA domain-containing protein
VPVVKIEMLIEAFPKLKKEYDVLVNQGYRANNYRLETYLQEELASDMLEIVLTNYQKSSILILQHKFHFSGGKFSDVFKTNIPSKSEINHSYIKLNRDSIQKKEFKKKLMGGYDCNEVDGFLDIIAEDYQYFKEKSDNSLVDK